MQCGNVDVISVKVIRNYVLYLQFEKGAEGEMNMPSFISFEGFFEPLKDESYFATVSVNPDIGTICWDNGADLSPSFLLKHINKT